jgi:hypothetical protein
VHEQEAVAAVPSLPLLAPGSVVADGDSDLAIVEAAFHVDHVYAWVAGVLDGVRERFRAGKRHIEGVLSLSKRYVASVPDHDGARMDRRLCGGTAHVPHRPVDMVEEVLEACAQVVDGIYEYRTVSERCPW